MKQLIPNDVKINIDIDTDDLGDLSDRIADNMMFVIAGLTVCSIVRNVVLAVIRK